MAPRQSASPGPRASVGPSAGRRSSVQPHRPYRDRDNVHQGRRTGVILPDVARNADGFEEFDLVLDHADRGTAGGKRKRKRLTIEETDELLTDHISEQQEYDDEDMEIESPLKKFGRTLRQSTSTANDFSPTSIATTSRGARRSDISSAAGSSPRRKSGLSRGAADDDDDDGNEPLDYNDGGGGYDDDFDATQTSFSAMNADDDEEDEEQDVSHGMEVESPPKPLSNRASSRGNRALSAVPEEDEEDGIAAGLDAVEDEVIQDEEDLEEEEEPPKKKTRAASAKKGKGKTKEPAAPRSRRKKENRFGSEIPENAIREKVHNNADAAPRGVRRSKRYHMKPLEWWRLEKVVYGRPTPPPTPDSSDLEDNDNLDPRGINRRHPQIALPHIKEVIRIPKEDVIPLGVAGKKRRSERSKRDRSRSRSRSRPPVKVIHEHINTHAQESVPPEPEDPEEGWDADTEPDAMVLHYPVPEGEEPKEITRKIVFPSGHLKTKKSTNANWEYQKTFGDAEYMACGVLIIPPGQRKPSKASKDNTYMFYVIEGAVNLAIHHSNRIVSNGGMFMIPRGNTYFIENISKRRAKLFFTQARKMREGEEDNPDISVEVANPRAQDGEENGGEERMDVRTTVDRESMAPIGSGTGAGKGKKAKR